MSFRTRGRRSLQRSLVRTLVALAGRYDRSGWSGVPPADFLRSAGPPDPASAPVDEDSARGFLRLARLRPLAEGLALESRIPRKTPSTSVILFLLTGQVKASERLLVESFVRGADFEAVASAVCALERLVPLEKYWYKYLVAKNLFSKDAVQRWLSEGDAVGERLRSEVRARLGLECRPQAPGSAGTGDGGRSPRSLNTSRMSPSTIGHMSTAGEDYPRAHTTNTIKLRPQKLGFGSRLESIKPQYPKPNLDAPNVRPILPEPPEGFRYDESEGTDLDMDLLRKELEGDAAIVEKEKGKKRNNEEFVKEQTTYRYGEVHGKHTDKKKLQTRTNAASLLREAEIILREEEAENRKILGLLLGSKSYIEYEKMIEKRIQEEKELFELRIQKLHLEGRLTDKAAVLAKLRLRKESQDRRKEFEKEREEMLKDMCKLREMEEEKISALVEKVKGVRKKVALRKKMLTDEKKQEVEKLVTRIRESLKEAVSKEKQELERKAEMIKEVRAFQAFKKTLQTVPKSRVEEKKWGLLSEMSMEELEERKRIVRDTIRSEWSRRRAHVLAEQRDREALLEHAENFITNCRKERTRRESRRSSLKKQDAMKKDGSIPALFLKPVPKPFREEQEYVDMASAFNEGVMGFKANVKKLREMSIKKSRNMRVLYEKDFDKMFVTSKRAASTYPKKPAIRRGSSQIKQRADKQEEMRMQLQSIWHKFKHSFRIHLTKKLRKMTYPPKSWIPKAFQGDLKSVYALDVSESASRKTVRKSKRFRASNALNKSRKNELKKKQRKGQSIHKHIVGKWLAFYYWYLQSEDRLKHSFTLEKFNDGHTQFIISQVNYYNELMNRGGEENKEKVNKFAREYRNEIFELKTRLQMMDEKLRKARRRNEKSLKKAFGIGVADGREVGDAKIRRRRGLVLPAGHEMTQVTYEETVRSVPGLEEEDAEILVREIKPPFQPIREETRRWLDENDLEKPPNVDQESSDESVIHVWEIPRRFRRTRPRLTPVGKLSTQLRLFSSYGAKYSMLKNTYGNPVFALKPTIRNPWKWEWLPVVICKKLSHVFLQLGEVPKDIKARSSRKEVMDNVKESQDNQHKSLLWQLMALRASESKYLRSLKGPERNEYFKKVPIAMVLDYMRTNPQGGEPVNRDFRPSWRYHGASSTT